MELAHKAVALDDRDHQAHCMLAMAQLYGGEYDAANRRITKALELNPNDTDVLAHAACAYPLIGDLESGVEAGRNALRLSPHHPEWYVSFVGLALLAARRYEEAIETMAAAPEAICDTPAYIAAAHAQLGQTAEALAHRKTVYRHYNGEIARGTFSRGKSCIEWLLEMCPFRRTEDADHYEEGLRKAGFE